MMDKLSIAIAMCFLENELPDIKAKNINQPFGDPKKLCKFYISYLRVSKFYFLVETSPLFSEDEMKYFLDSPSTLQNYLTKINLDFLFAVQFYKKNDSFIKINDFFKAERLVQELLKRY